MLPNYPYGGPQVYSPVKFWIDLATGQIRRASEQEWAGAQPYLPHRESIALNLVYNPPEHASYKGKTFAKRGAKWPLSSEHATRLSPDAGFLAVNSWDGEMKNCPELPLGFFCGTSVDCSLSCRRTFMKLKPQRWPSLLSEAEFGDIDPLDLFRRSAWISSRYYVLRLWILTTLDRFVLCDVPPTAGKGGK